MRLGSRPARANVGKSRSHFLQDKLVLAPFLALGRSHDVGQGKYPEQPSYVVQDGIAYLMRAMIRSAELTLSSGPRK